jgi:hypothetical protein
VPLTAVTWRPIKILLERRASIVKGLRIIDVPLETTNCWFRKLALQVWRTVYSEVLTEACIVTFSVDA